MKNLPEAPGKKERISRKALPPGVAKVMKRLHFPLDVILRCVRWYVAYSLSLRDLEEMIAEHGVEVDHSTVHRWVIKLVPLFEKSFRQHKRPVGKSWRMDETYIKVQGQWKYLFRGGEKDGDTVALFLESDRPERRAGNCDGGQKRLESGGPSGDQCRAGNTDQDSAMQVPEQHCGAGSPGHQTDPETVAGLQGFSVRAHHFVRRRGLAYDSGRSEAGEKRHPPVSRRAVLLAGDVGSPDDIDWARPSTVIATEPNVSPHGPPLQP